MFKCLQTINRDNRVQDLVTLEQILKHKLYTYFINKYINTACGITTVGICQVERGGGGGLKRHQVYRVSGFFRSYFREELVLLRSWFH